MRTLAFTIACVLVAASAFAQQSGGAGHDNGSKYKYGTETTSHFGAHNISNLEPTPKTVRVANQFWPVTMTGVNESGGIYCKTDPVGTGNQSVCMYLEVSSEQQDTEASAVKIIHKGAGDAFYVASFNNGPALETASFYNGSRGFISTNQRTMPGNGTDFGNTTLFNGVWGDDGTGGSTTPANYGIFYASLSLGNAFRVRLQNPESTGFAWGRTEIAISEYALARNRFEVYNNGLVRMLSTVATAGSTLNAAPALGLYGSYWNGAAAVDKTILLTPSMDGSGNPILYFQLGTAGAETNELILSTTSVDFQANSVSNIGELEIDGVSGSGKVICVKSDGYLGTCSDQPGAGGTCTCE